MCFLGACTGNGSSKAPWGILLGADDALVEKNALYRCLDKLLPHKEALFSHLRQRWQDLFGSKFDVLLYDLTSTYFESPPPEDKQDKRRFGYCLHVTLRARLKPLAPGLTPRAVLDKLAAVQMLDVHFPTTDGRTLVMSRYMEFNADQKLLVKQLKLDRPPRPHPRITATATAARVPASAL